MKSEFLREVLSKFTDRNRATYDLELMAKRDDFEANYADGGVLQSKKTLFYGMVYKPANRSYLIYEKGKDETVAIFNENDFELMSKFFDNFVFGYKDKHVYCYVKLPNIDVKTKLPDILESYSTLKVVETLAKDDAFTELLIKTTYMPSLQPIKNLLHGYLYSQSKVEIYMHRETLKETMFVIDVDPMEFGFAHQ